MVQHGFFLVAVHGGAGHHSEESEQAVRHVLRLGCKQALASLQTGAKALQAVEASIIVLEDDSCLNAGHGSNLTVEGKVECDASIMDGRTSDFGSVGAVFGVKNPIAAARAVLDYSRKPDKLGRIPPLLLVSDGAAAFSRQQGIPCVPADSLICPRALSEWKEWKDRLTRAASALEPPPASPQHDLHSIQDTVGAVAWCSDGDLAAGVSSGGLLLKNPGRVGEAATWGAGCWAEQSTEGPIQSGVACSVSGSGEYIVRVMLAKTICEAILASPETDTHAILRRQLVHFQERSLRRGEPEPIAGVLLLVKETDDEGMVHPRLWCAFTSASMAIAYASSLDPKPRALVLRRPTPIREDPVSAVYITALSLTR